MTVQISPNEQSAEHSTLAGSSQQAIDTPGKVLDITGLTVDIATPRGTLLRSKGKNSKCQNTSRYKCKSDFFYHG